VRLDLGKEFEETDLQSVIDQTNSDWDALEIIYARNLNHRLSSDEMLVIGKMLDAHLSLTALQSVVPSQVDDHILNIAIWMFNNGRDMDSVIEMARLELERFCLIQRVSRLEPDYIYGVVKFAQISSPLESCHAESD
jgi:hypothetical protein